MADVSCNAHTKKEDGEYRSCGTTRLYCMCGTRGVCLPRGSASRSVGCIRWLQEKILPSTVFFGSIYTGQNELRKNDGVTPVCFWKVAEKWLLS